MQTAVAMLERGLKTSSDAELLQDVSRGDVAALEEIYRRHASALMGLAMRLLGDRADAEDAVHDTFVHVHLRAAQYTSSRGAVIAWLVIMTRNTCFDRMRRGKRQRRVFDAASVEPPPLTIDPEVSLGDEQVRARVRLALASLTPAQRGTLEAAFFGGDTYSEIAAREGCALGTIKSRAARAIAALNTALTASGDVPEEQTEVTHRADTAAPMDAQAMRSGSR